ncbi:MAG TPA: amidohydrolase family protein [Chloroflexota bacterium]|nr:amidohydrolase family protein [Chloroflexota bacterium]
MRVIDADAHIDETEQTWEYMDEADRRLKPISFDLNEGEPAGPSDGRRHNLWLISGNARLRRFRSDKASGTTRATRELLDVPARLRHMDELGIEVQALYPTTFLHTVTARPEVELALCKTYNRWLADRTKESGGRLRWVAQAPVLTMDEVPAMLRFAKEHGACGVMKKGVECGNRAASDPYFFPLYEEANKLDLPVCFHQGTGDPEQSNTSDFARMAVLNVLSAFSSLAADHVPDQFPQLRFGFIEAGASWIPYLIKDLGIRGKAAKAPYEFKTGFLAHNRFYVTCDTEDDIAYLLNFGAEDYLMLGTDYSHVDQSGELEAHTVLMDQASGGAFSPAVATKINDTNARRFYGL